MTSESEYHKQQYLMAMEAKRQERIKARAYISSRYLDLGLDEADRDEILACLGIATDEDIDSPDYYGGGPLSRRGLTVRQSKAVVPRIPPSRASSP